MCYSARISIGTFVFATAVAGWVLRREPALAVTFVAITLMQLVEYFIWIDQKCGWINKLATSAIVPILKLQPLAIALAVWYFRAGLLPSVLYIVIALIVSLELVQALRDAYTNYGGCTRPGIDGRLVWDAVSWKKNQNGYYIAMIALFATMRPIIVTWPLLALYTLTYHMSSGPSVWCNTVNACAAWALIAA
jgi:hypothetical protein